MPLTPWERKAHELVARYCREAYLRANTPKRAVRRLLARDSRVRLVKKHRPYTVPAIANALVAALGIHEDVAREREIKRLFEVERQGAWSLI